MSADPAPDRQRIDKWLWHARVVKTRTGAQALVTAGRVRVNRERSLSASRAVKIGDVLTIGLNGGVRVLRVVGFAERRGSAPEASRLYEDLMTGPAPASAAEARSAPPGKHDRRAAIALKRAGGEDFSSDGS